MISMDSLPLTMLMDKT